MALVIRRIGANEFVPLSLEIYNAAGRYVQTVVDEHQSAGSHSVVWDAEGLPAGIYLVRLEIDASSITRKAVVLY